MKSALSKAENEKLGRNKMKTLTNVELKASHGDHSKDMGLVICRNCEELIDTLPTDGVKIFHGLCGRETCKDTDSDNL